MTSASMISSACIQSSASAIRDPVVERVRLALTALLAAQVHDPAVVLRRLGPHHVRGVVGARVVDDEHAQPVGRVLQPHQPVERRAEDGPLVPRRDDDDDPRQVRRRPAQVVAERVHRDQEVLVEPGEHRDRADADAGGQDGDQDVAPRDRHDVRTHS